MLGKNDLELGGRNGMFYPGGDDKKNFSTVESSLQFFFKRGCNGIIFRTMLILKIEHIRTNNFYKKIIYKN